MKKIFPIVLALFFILVFSISNSLAENIYVTGVTKITMRTGKGVEHKIVVMLKSGTKLEVIEHQSDWSHVRTMGGQQGWVMSRFLTEKIPDALLVDKLNQENEKLISRLSIIEEENKQLIIKNAALVQIEEKYKKLKQESGEFLELEGKYNMIMEQFNYQKNKIEKLENDSNRELKLWYLIGPGVLIVGFIFGLSTRRKKKSSLL
ncbi:MAG: TIGR04211 family SH3 domain-containing protein [Pseudomonadota bacterium]